MRFEGRTWKEGQDWLVEVPMLDVLTQGESEEDAYAMAKDAIESLVGKPDFEVTIHQGLEGRFEVSANDQHEWVAFLLRRQRQAHGLSLEQAKERMAAKSRNEWSRYERGESMPSVEKLGEMLSAVADRDIVIGLSSSAPTSQSPPAPPRTPPDARA
jgi:predicted RNase H-like HicB family nuclease